MKLWPDQFLNKKVQEHDAVLKEMEKRVKALESKPVKQRRTPKIKGE